ncbi:MAG: helix-turn-helix domain-containing protein [Actinomycetota bacterium]
MDLAERMRTLREQAGLTMTALAKPRYTVSYISQIESGRRNPSGEAMEFFAEQLGVTPRYLSTGIPDGAEDELRYALEDARQAFRQGELEHADLGLVEVLERATDYNLPRLRGEALVLRGDILAGRGDLRDAVDVYEEALEHGIAQRHAGLAISGLARAYRSMGDLTYSVELVEKFLAGGDQPLDPGVSAELQSVLVSLYFERGDIERATRASERALVAAEQGVSPEIRANTYWDASRIKAEAKQWDEALELATRARLLMEEMEDRRSAARLYNVAAFICLEADPPRLAEAKRHLDKAEKVLRRIGAPADMAYCLTERARLALLERKPAQAIAAVEEALKVVGDDGLERARALFLKGRALAMTHKSEEAVEVLNEAAGAFREHGARQQEAACLRELGDLYEKLGRADDALKAMRAGLDALDQARSRA